MVDQDEIRLSFPADRAYAPIASRGAEAVALKRGFSPETAARISLALEEAIIDSCEMGYGGLKYRIKIHIAQSSAGLEITVLSKGLPLNPEQLPQYDPVKADGRYDAGGISFFLIKQLMDEVSFSALANGERKLTLVKRLPQALAVPDQVPQSGKAAIKIKSDPDAPYRVRPAGPEDAESISRLALIAHGKVLFSKEIYYPARVEEMMLTGKMTSVVCDAGNGEIFGHVALVPLDLRGLIEEMTYGFVDPLFRNRGAVSAMVEFLIRDARQRGVHALVVAAVTNHDLSQKAAARMGYKASALLIATSAPSAKLDNAQTGRVGRIGNLTMVCYLNRTSAAKLYFPALHEAMIRKIYRHLGKEIVAEAIADESMEPPTGPAEVWSQSDLIEGWMAIFVEAFGSDVQNRVKLLTQEAIAQQIPVIQLILPLDDPFTALMTPLFERDGFFFAGIAPDAGAMENLILQRLNTPDPGWEAIRVMDGFASEIKDYVYRCGWNASNV